GRQPEQQQRLAPLGRRADASRRRAGVVCLRTIRRLEMARRPDAVDQRGTLAPQRYRALVPPAERICQLALAVYLLDALPRWHARLSTYQEPALRHLTAVSAAVLSLVTLLLALSL